MRAGINMTGLRYGTVTAIRCVGRCSDGAWKWLLRCDCGAEFVTSGAKVRSGEVRTCPPCSRERGRLSCVTHGMRRTAEYRIWSHIKSRCLNPLVPEYRNYGGRGIKICDRWLDSFEYFLADMGHRPSPLHSIDRYPDNNGNYEHSNCRWATMTEQANNKRNNRLVEIGGVTKTMSEWAAEYGMRREKVWKRLKRGKVGESVIAETAAPTPIDYGGRSLTIPEWSAVTGIKKATLYWRINSQKWPIDLALTKGASQ